ncbi:MAG: DUF4810 domain-containing protein [Betaproteobacteria bacterium]
MRHIWTSLILSLLLTGCAAHREPLYTWGHYEEQIYTSYSEPGKLTPEQQIEELEQDYQKARSTNKRMHPGFHAQLGYLYVQVGKFDQARQEFATEKADFPESTVLMDRLTANLAKK